MGYQRQTQVRCKDCGKWMNTGKVEFLDIAEDIRGRDEMTFKCPGCKTTQKSLVRI